MSRSASEPSAVPVRPLADNRRRGRRHRLEITASLLLDGTPPRQIQVIITDLSVAGVGMRCDEPLTPGDAGEVRAFDSLVPVGMRVKVVSHRPTTKGFEIGAEVLPAGIAPSAC